MYFIYIYANCAISVSMIYIFFAKSQVGEKIMVKVFISISFMLSA
jgi:hypothetical protein